MISNEHLKNDYKTLENIDVLSYLGEGEFLSVILNNIERDENILFFTLDDDLFNDYLMAKYDIETESDENGNYWITNIDE